MAKLNWQKLNQKSKQQSFNEKAPTPYPLSFKDNGLWAVKGKYYGIHLSKLPNDYLFWITEKFTGIHKDIAESEIYRRYNQLTNT